jgi:histidyl-tRNA synthetase
MPNGRDGEQSRTILDDLLPIAYSAHNNKRQINKRKGQEMKIPPVKGTRDFYPAEMAVRNFIIDGWKKVSIRNGFEEFDSPILEHLQMFTLKSGDEIVEQLFSLKDRGGRDLALIPEMTPSLARMVNQRINSLPKPIKWFSVPRLFRAERPQKGRLREFFQWNIDIIGVEGGFGRALADAEVIFTTVDYLREVGLTSKDIKVKISSRELLASFLKGLGIPDEKLQSVYAVLDKKSKLPPETFEKILGEQISDKKAVGKILDFISVDSIPELKKLAENESDQNNAYLDIQYVLDHLKAMEVGDFCVYDPSIVRGLAYYTGIVFEVHDITGDLRAICGGGRYDNLLKDFGGPDVSATGMGMGDCILEILLREKGLLDRKIPAKTLDYFIAYMGPFGDEARSIVGKLRSMKKSVNFCYKPSSISSQLKEASAQNARNCIIIGYDELKKKEITIKDMSSGQQQTVPISKFLQNPEVFLRSE